MRTNFQHLLIQEDNHVLKISMNRPEVYNAFNDTMLDELGEVLETAAQDAAVRCVVLTGTGRAFGSGQDLRSLATIQASRTASAARALCSMDRCSSKTPANVPRSPIKLRRGGLLHR